MAAARKARAAGDLSEALRLYELALSRDPLNGFLALELSETLLDGGDAVRAGRVLSLLVAAEPQRPAPRRALARALLAQGKPDEALAHAREAVKLDPKSAESATLLGFVLVAAGQPEDAVLCFRRALAARPGDRDAHGGLALSYAALSDPRADKEFQAVLAASPEVRYRWQYAEYLWRLRDVERGNLQMEQALEAAPGDPALLEAYGQELFEQGRFAQAARRLAQARDASAGKASYELLTHLGSAEIEESHFDEAERVLREAVAQSPSDFTARHRLGVVFLMTGKTEEAREELARAVDRAKDPRESAAPRVDLGRAEEAAGNLDAAEAAYRKAIENDPSLARARYLLGLLLSKRGKAEEARAEMAGYQAAYEREQSGRQRETSRRARINQGWVELRQKRFAAALAHFESHPEDAEALRGAGEALSAMGRRREAIAALERAFVKAPEDRGIAWRLREEKRKAER